MISAKASSTLGQLSVEVDGMTLMTNTQDQNAGGDVFAKPLRLLLAGLAACTSNALTELAALNGWSLTALDVDVEVLGAGEQMQIQRILSIEGDLDEKQREMLLDAAEMTPVTLYLRRGFPIKTELA